MPTALMLLMLAVIVGTVLQLSTHRTDELAVVRENQRMRMAVDHGLNAVAVNQEASTFWDDAVIRTRQRPLDLEWIDNNLGVWFHTYYGIDETYLVDPRDRPIYAMQNGDRRLPASFALRADPALMLAAQLRKKLLIKGLVQEGAAGQTVGVSEIVLFDGRPAFVSLKPILPETANVAQPSGAEYLHVAVRYLDRTFLDKIGKHNVFDDPKFSQTHPGRASVPLRASNGRILGYLTWKPFESGAQVERQMIPPLLVALLIVAGITGLLLWRIQRDRSKLESTRAEAQHLAFHDSLTGLPNRALFEDRLEQAVGRRDFSATVLLLDLDRFKNVNDTLGHQAGDALIREFSKRLTALTRQSDTVARLGGDEFAILVEATTQANILRLAERILIEVRKPFAIVDAEVYVGVSIGVAVTQGTKIEPLELMRMADIALYGAKDDGRGRWRLFSPQMDECVKLRSAIEASLRQAIAEDEGLCLHFQPQVASNGKILGVEALLRWIRPDGTLAMPDEFISVAEDTGLIIPLGDWVLRQACIASRRWSGLFVGVNLSPVQFRAPDFLQRLLQIVGETGADPSAIQLEVTEQVLLDDDESVHALIAGLRAAGFKIVLDDFGTGYSSLSYLRKFAIDKIKIDGSFVQHLGEEADSAAIIRAMLALGRAMGITVSAEGVETAEQLEFLQLAGCTEMQGYYFSRALPADQITSLVLANGASSVAA